MYREALRPLQCPTCGGTHITPATLFKSQGHATGIHLVFQGPDVSWASTGQVGIPASRGRVCLDCGYVLVFLDGAELMQLRARIATLQPFLPDEPA